MAAPLAIPDYAALLASFLLTEYLVQLGNPRLTEEERFEIRRRLDYHLWTMEDRAPQTAVYLTRAVGAAFAGELEVRAAPTIEWYLDFLSCRDEQSLREVDRPALVRCWRLLPTRLQRNRVLHTLVHIDLIANPDHPEASQVRLMLTEEVEKGGLDELSRPRRRSSNTSCWKPPLLRRRAGTSATCATSACGS